MPVYQLGNGNKYFNSASQPDWTNDSTVIGGNGGDTIYASAVTPFDSSHLVVVGGNGNDYIRLYAENSVAIGGNGNDTLISSGGGGNTLIGGNGSDTLVSLGGGSGMGPGTTLTGGNGHNTYNLINVGNLVVTNDAAGNGVVSNGDVFEGPMDVITDLHHGDHIGLRDYDINTNGPTATDVPVARIDSVTLASDPLPHAGDSFRPVIGTGQYAVFHGTFAGGNTFTVNASGPDLFVAYDDNLPSPNQLVGKGSLVLLGVSDESLLRQALSPVLRQGSGDWNCSFDQTRGGHNAPASAMLHCSASNTSAVSLVPTT